MRWCDVCVRVCARALSTRPFRYSGIAVRRGRAMWIPAPRGGFLYDCVCLLICLCLYVCFLLCVCFCTCVIQSPLFLCVFACAPVHRREENGKSDNFCLSKEVADIDREQEQDVVISLSSLRQSFLPHFFFS